MRLRHPQEFQSYQGTEVPSFNTSNCTDFSYAFANCPNLLSIPEIDTSNGTTFNYFCYGATSLIEFPKINTSKGYKFYYFFHSFYIVATI